MVATVSGQTPLLKRLYGSKVSEPMYQRSKFLASIKKDTNFGGEGKYVNVTVGPTAGGSADFATALANQDQTTEIRFFVTHKKEYQVFSIQGDLIARSRGDKNAILEAVKQQADKARYSFFRSMAARAWGDAGGALGRISTGSNVATTTITLATRADVVRFEPGMRVTLASDTGAGSSPAGTRDGGAQLRITAIDREAGTLTANAAWNTIAGAATSDYIHRAGDYSVAMTGARGWAPVAAPSASENFFGVDRTLYDIQRQSGIRYDDNTGGSKEETLISAAAEGQMAGMGGGGLRCYANPLDVADLVKELGSKVTYNKSVGTKEASISFSAVMVHTPLGEIPVFSEVDVPKGYAWILDTDQITLGTAGDCPQMLNEDGVGKLMRSATDDAYQGRLGCYGNFLFDNPGHSVIITW